MSLIKQGNANELMIDPKTLTEKQQRRYDRILQTSEDMMYNQGFYKLSLAELTKKLSVSRSTIYEYFGSKEGLVEMVVNDITARLDYSLAEIVKNKEFDSHDKFIRLAQAQSQILDVNCYRLFNDLKIHMPYLWEQFRQGQRKREENGYKKLIKQGLKEGLFDKKLDKDFLLQLYLKMGRLIGDTDLIEHIRMNKVEAMESIIKVFLNGTQKQ